ncbi:MAG: spore germination protein [Bacillus sp. (in: Bacteria)]|nr:spore germination protein [Bacillus sp. (in: firmicutes)]
MSKYVDVYAALPTSTITVKNQMNAIFTENYDYTERNFHLKNSRSVYISYFSGLIKQDLLEQSVIKPLLEAEFIPTAQELGTIISVTHYESVKTWKDAVAGVLEGNVLLHIDQLDPVIIFLANKKERSPNDPTTDYQVYGPKMGFIEDGEANIAMLRQFIKDPRLKTRQYDLGTVSNTKVSVIYLEQYCEQQVIHHVDTKLKTFDRENLFNYGELSKYLNEHPYSIFPQTSLSERPDKVAYSLLQGKIILFIDNSTFCAIAPVTLMDMIETSEDQAFLGRWNLLFIRCLRLVCLFLGTTLPALYVSLVAFQPELIPTTLTISVAQARVNIPLPATAEAFLMMFALDVLTEASIRLPSFVGQTIGIVGGLVIGQAAVEAGLISNTMVIVIAFTAICIFTLPSWEFVNSWRITRYLLVCASALLGLYGLVLATGFLLLHLCKIESLNKPYMFPFAPFDRKRAMAFLFPKR